MGILLDNVIGGAGGGWDSGDDFPEGEGGVVGSRDAGLHSIGINPLLEALMASEGVLAGEIIADGFLLGGDVFFEREN